jgi:hypothetical protein
MRRCEAPQGARLRSALRRLCACLGLSLVAGGCAYAAAGDCNVPDDAGYRYCVDYVGTTYNPGLAMSGCAALGGEYNAGACDDATDGICTFLGGTTTELRYSYFDLDPGIDAGVVSDACTAQGGKFSQM